MLVSDNGILRFRKVTLGLQDDSRAAVTGGPERGRPGGGQSRRPGPRQDHQAGHQASRPGELMDLAIYDLKLHKGRFIATILGVGLLFTIVLAMNGLYRGNIYEGLSIIQATNPDLWVVERFRGGPFNEQSSMSENYHYSIKAVPGVEKACPFIYYTVERQIGDKSRHFSIIGYDIFAGLGGPQRIVAGRGLRQAHYEMVADKKLGVQLGDQIPLGLHTYTVVGLTQGAIDTNGDPLVFLSLPDAQEVAYQKDNEEVRTQRARLARTLNGQKSLSPGCHQSGGVFGP